MLAPLLRRATWSGWTYQPPVRLRRRLRRARNYRRARRLRHHRRTAPGWCTRHRRSVPTTSRSARRTACPWSTRSAPTAISPPTSRWSAACSSRTPTRSWSPTCRHAACCSGTSRTRTRYPHCWRCHTPLMYYALPSWYVRTTAIKDRLLAENEATNWYPADDQARPLRRLADQQHRLGAVARPVLGHPAAGLAQRRRPVAHGVRRARWPSCASCPGWTSDDPHRPVRRRRHVHPCPARTARTGGCRR